MKFANPSPPRKNLFKGTTPYLDCNAPEIQISKFSPLTANFGIRASVEFYFIIF
jgi:hypothetical protein